MKVVERIWEARQFPVNTCAASRITEGLGFALFDGEEYPLLAESPAEVGIYLLDTVACLYEARTEVARLKAELDKRPFSE
jgi:hypothetical protein